MQPAHTITLLSPVTIVNLLPYDLHYAVKDAVTNCAGHIKPGQSSLLTQVPLLKCVVYPSPLEGLSLTEGCIVHAYCSNTVSGISSVFTL